MGGRTEKEALRAFAVAREGAGGQREEPAEVEGVFHTVLSPAAKVSGELDTVKTELVSFVENLLPACMHGLGA